MARRSTQPLLQALPELGADRRGSNKIQLGPPRNLISNWPDNTQAGITLRCAGSPVGVQVAARPWREDVVVAVMSTLDADFKVRPDYPLRTKI